MKKFSVTYNETIDHEACDLPVDSIDEAAALVREVIGDDIHITSINVYGDKSVVQYDVVTSHEAVIEARYKDEAKEKLLIVVPDAEITDTWELKEQPKDKRVILNEELVTELETLEVPSDSEVERMSDEEPQVELN